jgi:hypothetical protein
MTRTRAALLVLLGIMLGFVGSAIVRPAEAQTAQLRMQTTPAGTVGAGLANEDVYLMKDSRSGGCWLLLVGNRTISNVAPAPASACY